MLGALRVHVAAGAAADVVERTAHPRSQVHQMRRVAAGVGATTPEGLFEEGLRLYAGGRYQAAVDKLKEAAALGHVAAHSELAWLLMNGREGVPADFNGAVKLAKEGAGLGCMHSLGVHAYCYLIGTGCRKNSTL